MKEVKNNLGNIAYPKVDVIEILRFALNDR